MPRIRLGERYMTREERGRKALIEYISSKTGRHLMSQEELAAKIGLSPVTLSKRMNGRSKFTYNDIMAICRVFDPPDEVILSFFGRVPQKSRKSA